jgi:D-inositol-3-phosphate glycosyltransferase
MRPGIGKFTRRVAATRRVWSAGAAHLAMFAPPAPPAPELIPLPSGFLDAPRRGSVLPREPFMIRGWALFPSGAPTRVDLWLGETALGPARLGGYRPDVQSDYGDHGMIAEFEHLLDLGEWEGPPGEVLVRAVATGPDGERHELPPVVAHLAPVMHGDDASAVAAVPAPPDAVDGRRLRVLVFTHRLDIGGAQLILLDVVRGLQGTGAFDCTVVSPFDGELRASFEAAGAHVHVSGPIPTEDPRVYSARVDEVAAWAEVRGADVALVNTSIVFAGGDVAARLGIPALWAIHESYTPASLWRLVHPLMHPEVGRRAAAALRGAAGAIFEAAATQRLYEPHVDGPCVTSPFGIDLAAIERARERFDPVAARKARDVPLDARVLICVGTVEPRKAQIPLVQAFAGIAGRHPDAQLVIIGAGRDQYSQALHAYAETCAPPGRVRVLPVTSDTWPWYALADFMVCASDLESLPRSVLEAMAWETPVVATSIFGLPDLIEPGVTGWLCEPRDVGELAAALDRALSTPPAELRAIVRSGRALVEERHDGDAYVATWARLLREVAEAGPVDASQAAA